VLQQNTPTGLMTVKDECVRDDPCLQIRASPRCQLGHHRACAHIEYHVGRPKVDARLTQLPHITDLDWPSI